MIRLAVMVLAMVLIPLPGRAVTMEEAVSLALKNNHRVGQFRQQTQAQERRVDSAKSPFYPAVEAAYSYQRRENVFSFFQTRDSSTFSGEIRYNLFRGFADWNTLRSARSILDSARYEEKAAEADTALDAKRAYIEVLRARRRTEVARESVGLLERQRRDAEAFFRGGLTAKNEFLRVEVELATARQELLVADSALDVARGTLERVIGVPLAEIGQVEEIADPDPVGIDERALAERMLENRSELRFLEAQRTAREYVRDTVRGRYLPAVDLSATHSRFGETHAFEGVPDPLFDSDTIVLAEARWNLFEGFRTRNDVLAEEALIRALTEQILDTRADLLLQLTTAVEGYRVAAGRIDLARASVAQAEENYRITENQFRERVSTAADLLDARVFLTRARTEYNTSFYDLRLAIATLERVVEGPVEERRTDGVPSEN